MRGELLTSLSRRRHWASAAAFRCAALPGVHVGAATRHLSAEAGPRPGPAPLLAADVGGTHVRVGLVQALAPEALLHYRKFACADYPGLAEVLRAFLATVPGGDAVRHGVIASAWRPASGTSAGLLRRETALLPT